jgi:predicted MFS family arabinose efflux permease
MALGAILGPVVAAGGGWQDNFYFCAPIAVVLSFACWKFIKSDESKKVEEHYQLLKASSSTSGVSTHTKAVRKKKGTSRLYRDYYANCDNRQFSHSNHT